MAFAERVFERAEGADTVPPPAGARLWWAWNDIFTPPGMEGGHPTPWTEIRAWSATMRQPLSPSEATIIRRLGDLWARVQARNAPDRPGRAATQVADGKPTARSIGDVFRRAAGVASKS